MYSTSKQIISVMILISFLTIVFLSVVAMLHMPDGDMSGDCPFSALGDSLCPQDAVTVALHHISAYQSFFNVPVGSGQTALIISLLLATYAMLVIGIRSPLRGPPATVRLVYGSPPVNSYERKITRWLSLFENSPSTY